MYTAAFTFLKKFWPYILGALLIVVCVIWWNSYISSVEERGYKRGYDKATAEYNVEKLKQAEVNQKAFAKLVSDRDAGNALLTASTDAAMKKLQESQHETKRLRDLANAGRVGLHINAHCPTAGTDSQVTGYASLDTGTGAELDPTARQAYFDLRDGIDTVESKLAACQGELKLRQ